MTGSLESSEARATRCEMDLSGGTRRSPRRVRAGEMRVTGLSKVLRSSLFEDFQFFFGEFTVIAFGERAQQYGADTHALEREQTKPHRSAGASYYAVTALVDGEVEDGYSLLAADARELRGEHRSVFEPWASGEHGEAPFEVVFWCRSEG